MNMESRTVRKLPEIKGIRRFRMYTEEKTQKSSQASRNLRKKKTLASLYLLKDRSSNISTEVPYIPEEIELEKSKISRQELFYERMYEKKINLILHSLNKGNNQKKKQSKEQKVKNPFKYDQVIKAYKEYKQKKPKEEANIKQFVEALLPINNFFMKLDFLVSLSLFQLGKIKTFLPSQFLYHEDDPLVSFFIILWGEFKLKSRFTKKVQYLVPGDSLGEELILNQEEMTKVKTISLKKGVEPRIESAKSMTESGVLQLSRQDYYRIQRSLCENGLKDKFFIAEKLMKWSYTKKKSFI